MGVIHKPNLRLLTTDSVAIETNLQWCLEWEAWDVNVKHQQIQSNSSRKGPRIDEI